MRTPKIRRQPAIKRWLTHTGSLTQKIERGLGTTLKVQSCFQGETRPLTLEQHVIRTAPNLFGFKKKSHSGWCREVTLGCEQLCYLYARILILKPAETQLLRIKANAQQPLGRWLYKDPQTTRTLLYTDDFRQSQHQFGLPTQWHTQAHLPFTTESSAHALIRCSHIQSQNIQLLVTEVYLQDLISRIEHAQRRSRATQ